MTEPLALTPEILDNWADDAQGPVALHLKQKLLPVELDGKVIYPPTYADIGYNIDTLSDGTRVATIDSVGSQANRMEPIFKFDPYSSLVPQIQIELHSKGEEEERHVEMRWILDLAHRRGESNERRPRLVRSMIRAWDVDPLHAAAQFNSVWKALDDSQKTGLESEAKVKKVKLSEKGFKDAPAIFRKTGARIPEFRDGAPNPERRVLGGVLVNGSIERDVTVNLIALRALGGANDQETCSIQRYLLALALLAATAEIELFLREGCHLRFADDDRWNAIPRRGDPTPVDLVSESARETLLTYAQGVVEPFRSDWPKELVHKFDMSEAKKLLAKKAEDEESGG